MEDGDRANNVVVHHHHGGLTLGLPASNLPAALAATAGGGGGSREDCWSEGATNTLIDSWGERYLNLNRGNLKQKHWREVSDAVNARSGGHKLRKTDVQCKNRLDTLKKKYKLEKAKICNGILIGPSKWPFYAKLDNLIGPSRNKHHQALKHFRLHPQPQPQPLPPPLPPPLPSKRPDGGFNSLSSGSVDATESLPSDGADEKHKRGRRSSSSSQSPVRELAQAIMKFGEIYERIEGTKQQQMMELEKHRMEFTRDLEVQRMQLFMQTQIEVAKMEHAKHGGTEHYL